MNAIRFDVPDEEYRKGDGVPRLSQSLAKTLLAYSPRHAWMECPALNPAFRPDDERKFDIGTAAHSILIGRGKRIQAVDFDDWRTKAAKEQRESLQSEGILAVKRSDYNRASEMAKVAKEQTSEWLGEKAKDFRGEVVIRWTQDGIDMATMIDLLSEDNRLVIDYKTTAASASPNAIPMKIATDGWDIQAATHKLALDAVDPQNTGRRTHLFICQENFPPYALTVVEMTEAIMTMGHKRLMVAMEKWQECIESGNWPMYPTEVLRPVYPSWAESEWLRRELEEFAHEAD